MDAAEMIKMSGIHQQAGKVRDSLMPKVPSPKSMMDRYKPMHFEHLTNGSKKFVIEPWKSEKFPITNMRHAIMFGVRPTTANYGREMEFHRLLMIERQGRDKGKSVLTSDAPIEVYTQWLAFSKAKGNVLVGGLGLGMAPTMMLDMPGVKSVTVVEKEPAIIKLVGPQVDKRLSIIEADLYEFLKTKPTGFDFAYHDIWYDTGEGTWAEHVVPLYRLTRKAGINRMGAWGEHEMRWQLAEALYARTCLEEKYSTWKPYNVFLKGVKKVLGGEPPYGPEHKDKIVKLIKLYLGGIGTTRWERTFDWDGGCNGADKDR